MFWATRPIAITTLRESQEGAPLESLKRSHDQVADALRRRIEIGRDLASRLNASAVDLERESTAWHDYNKQLLEILFTGMAEVEAYDRQTTIHVVRDEADRVAADRGRVTELTDRLESLLARLELFPVAVMGGSAVSGADDRRRYLESLYELVGGGASTKAVRSDEVGMHAGLDDEVRRHAEAYLKAEGDITYLAFGPQVALTHQGRKRVEASEAPAAEASPNVQNVLNFFGDVTNSAVAVGHSDAIVVPPAAEQVARIDEWIEAVRALDLAVLPDHHQALVASKLKSLEAELESPAPDRGVIAQGVRVVQRVLESTAGSLGAQGVLQMGALIIESVA